MSNVQSREDAAQAGGRTVMKHPARYSRQIVEVLAEILTSRWPDWFGRPLLHDPFAGTGERLAEMAERTGFHYSGTEIEECFIVAPHILAGDSTKWETYPPARHPIEYGAGNWVVVTSPAYSNGVSDHHLARDSSTRKTYRKAKAEITGDPEVELLPNNMGRWSYRGTKRPEDGGRSARREAYWRLAQESVRHWTTAELVLVNVSDFIAKHEIVEPLVDDWCELLSVYGWTNQVRHEVVTPRMRHGQNADKRVAAEVIIEATRG